MSTKALSDKHGVHVFKMGKDNIIVAPDMDDEAI
jgi:hypothetical protein